MSRRAWLGLLTAGCGYFMPDRNLAEKVEEHDLAGTWTRLSPNAQQIAKYKLIPEPPASLTLNEGGICQPGTDTFCAWRVKHDLPGHNGSTLPNQVSVELRTVGMRPQTWNFGVGKEAGKLRLWEFLGDPDQWEFVEYEQRSPKPEN